MNIKFVTSMSWKYYNHCGKAMLKSFKKTQGKFYNIDLYNEDHFSSKVKGVVSKGWNLGDDYLEFVERWKSNSKVVTFSKKGFSLIAAMEECLESDVDRLIWLDADLILTATIPEQLFAWMCPDDTLSAHFGVQHTQDDKTYFSCETGFTMLNCKHPMFKDFYETYKYIYTHDDVTLLRRFYDGEVYGLTVKRLEQQGAKMCELSPEAYKYKTPIGKSVLAPYLTHLKAGLKDRINPKDLEELYDLNKDIEDEV